MSSKQIVHTVSAYITQHKLLSPGDTHLVALSGGADSVALLRLLLTLHYKVAAAHCNFHLRGAESDRDEDFCRALCARYDVQLHVTHFDTQTYSRTHRVSIEMAARELRYRWFCQLTDIHGYATVCVAHHADDAVETMLLNMLRGSGIHGLTGIRRRNGNIVRPLLCLERKDITAFLADIGQDYVTDSSNEVDDVCRNRIRLRLLPLLEEIVPAARSSLKKTMHHLSETTLVTDELMEAYKTEHIGLLVPHEGEQSGWYMEQQHVHGESFLFYLLHAHGFNSAQVEEIWRYLSHSSHAVEGESREWGSLTGFTCSVSRGCVYVWKNLHPEAQTIPACQKQTLSLPHAMYVDIDTADVGADFVVPHSEEQACLDVQHLAFPLTLRLWQNGDRFQPFGMKGTQLVSDYLTNRHVNPFERAHQYVLTDAHGRICWLVGRRIAHHCRITDATTHALQLTYHHSTNTP